MILHHLILKNEKRADCCYRLLNCHWRQWRFPLSCSSSDMNTCFVRDSAWDAQLSETLLETLGWKQLKTLPNCVFFLSFFFTEAWSQKSNRDHTEKVTEIISYVWTLILCTWASNKKEFFPSRLRRSKNFLSQSSELIETSFLNFQLRSLNSIFM